MSQPIDRAGNFRGVVIECSLYEAKAPSKSKSINIVVKLESMWDPDEQQWVDWLEYDVTAEGQVWVIKKDGTINTRAAESVINFAGWNGSLESIANGMFGKSAKPCQFSIEEERPNDYHDDTIFKIAFINEYDRTPGENGNVSPERAKELQTEYGSQFRALAGNAVRNAAPPATKKLKTPSRGKKPEGKPTTEELNKKFDEAMEDENGSDIPF